MSMVTAVEKEELSLQEPTGPNDVERSTRTESNSNYLRGIEFILVFSSVSENPVHVAKLIHSLDSALLLSVFLVSLDQTIVSIILRAFMVQYDEVFPQVATALPRIVSVFNSLDLATWVAAACEAFELVYFKFY
jgi:hypothetical protein